MQQRWVYRSLHAHELWSAAFIVGCKNRKYLWKDVARHCVNGVHIKHLVDGRLVGEAPQMRTGTPQMTPVMI